MTTPPSVENMSPSKSASAADVTSPSGLTSEEARRRWEKFGPNLMPDTALHPLRMAIEKFWAPVPWMLEAAIVLEVALGTVLLFIADPRICISRNEMSSYLLSSQRTMRTHRRLWSSVVGRRQQALDDPVILVAIGNTAER